jgi:chromosome partitioning protein
VTARIIVSTALKGGAGKTTIAMQIAGTLALRGRKVLVADADRQGTASRWAAAAEDGKPFPAVVAGFSEFGSKVHREIIRVAEDYEFICVDCPPAEDSPIPESALLVADVALVPVVPSPLDVWSSTKIRDRIERADTINEGIVARSRLVLNMVQPNTTLAREVSDALAEFGVSLVESHLSLRQVYRQAAAFGTTVHSFGSRAQAAVDEVNALTDEVLALLGAEPDVATAQGGEP